jgi:protein-tyrosine-phosphatase
MWFRRKRILAVCTGNTCRSPMVEGFLKKNLPWWRYKVESAGTSVGGSSAATPESVTAMAGIGIDIGSHRSRQLTKTMAEKADIILVLSPSNASSNILRPFSQKIIILGISDPYGGNQEEYYACRNQIIDRLQTVAALPLIQIKGALQCGTIYG